MLLSLFKVDMFLWTYIYMSLAVKELRMYSNVKITNKFKNIL